MSALHPQARRHDLLGYEYVRIHPGGLLHSNTCVTAAHCAAEQHRRHMSS